MDKIEMLEMLRQTDKLTISTQIIIIDNLIKENRELRKELNKQTDLQSKGFIYIDPNTGEKKPVRFLEFGESSINEDIPKEHKVCGCPDCGDCYCEKCNPRIPMP